MKDFCIPPDEIPEILRRPSGSPEREHLEDCPRCRAVMMAYLEFVEDRSIPPGADLEDAESSLRTAFLASLSPTASTARDDGGAMPVVDRPRRHPPWSRGLRGIWILAPAIVMLAVGLYVGLRPLDRDSGPDRLRGIAPAAPGRGMQTILLLEPGLRSADGVELRWRSVPAASSYEVVLFGADLADLARLKAVTDTLCVVRRGDLHPEPRAEALVGWQVIAQRDGAVIARSPIAAIRLP